MSEITNSDSNIIQQNINSNVENNYGEKKIKKFLGAPFISDTFLGREDDLKAIHKKLFLEKNFLMLVNGEGGIGKTTLASRYYLIYQEEYQHLAWIFADNSLLDALLQLANPLNLRFPETMGSKERLQELLNEMRNLHKPCLLVIDNANKLEDLENYYYALLSCPNFHLLLTTRITEFEHAACYKINALPEDKAIELFIKYYPMHRRSEDDLFKQIRTAVGGNTLVIELIAKNLHIFNRLQNQYSLVDLLRDLQNEGLLLLKKSQVVFTGYQDMRKAKPEDIIAAMYNLGELNEAEKYLLSNFAVLPAESILFSTLQTLFQNLDGLGDTLLKLAQKGWLEFTEEDANKSFKVSPVIQEITKKKSQHQLEDCKILINRLIEKLDYDIGTGHLINTSYQDALMYARYAESIIENFNSADNGLAILNERLGNYHFTIGNLSKALNYYELYTQFGKELCAQYPENEGYKKGLAISYEKLGDTHSSLGNLSKALSYYGDEMLLFLEFYQAYPENVDFKRDMAIAYSKLGEAHVSLGNLSLGLSFYELDAQLSEELYKAYPENVDFKNGLAISYSKLGEVHGSLGDLSKSLNYYEEDVQLSSELYSAYPDNVGFKNSLAISYEKLGETHGSLGNLSKALGYYNMHNQLIRELYNAYLVNVGFKNGLAVSYEKLAEVHSNLGNLSEALSYYDERLKLGKELYEAYPEYVEFKNGLALSYKLVGWFYEDKMQNPEKAKEFYLSSKDLLLQLTDSSPDYIEFARNLDWVNKKLSR